MRLCELGRRDHIFFILANARFDPFAVVVAFELAGMKYYITDKLSIAGTIALKTFSYHSFLLRSSPFRFLVCFLLSSLFVAKMNTADISLGFLDDSPLFRESIEGLLDALDAYSFLARKDSFTSFKVAC